MRDRDGPYYIDEDAETCYVAPDHTTGERWRTNSNLSALACSILQPHGLVAYLTLHLKRETKEHKSCLLSNGAGRENTYLQKLL